MRKKMKGSLTIEAAIIVPLAILMFAVVISMLFYYHDKNVITGAVYEVVADGTIQAEPTKEELGMKLQEKVNKRLLLFSAVYVDAYMDKSKLVMECHAAKNGMTLYVKIAMNRTEPENYIRKIRGFQNINNQLGESDESIL